MTDHYIKHIKKVIGDVITNFNTEKNQATYSFTDDWVDQGERSMGVCISTLLTKSQLLRRFEICGVDAVIRELKYKKICVLKATMLSPTYLCYLRIIEDQDIIEEGKLYEQNDEEENKTHNRTISSNSLYSIDLV